MHVNLQRLTGSPKAVETAKGYRSGPEGASRPSGRTGRSSRKPGGGGIGTGAHIAHNFWFLESPSCKAGALLNSGANP